MLMSLTGLGKTVAELPLGEHNVPVFEKKKFSMCLPPIQEIIKDKEVCNPSLSQVSSLYYVYLFGLWSVCIDLGDLSHNL